MAEELETSVEASAVEAEPARPVIAVIDGNSLMHRAFHAIMQPMSAPDGRPTNALFGFFNMFIKLVESFEPDGVICAFDKGKPAVRMEMLPSYKAQRPPMDENLHVQFPMVKELLRALDVPVCELEGWEGDDILGTLAVRGEAEGYDMLLFTGDRDMYQLATDHIRIASTKKGVSEVAIMTPESVDDLYHGITPELVPDFYGLKGDSSDNIPGVPGIGPKKAAALIVEYGSLDAVVEHASEIGGKLGENLRAHIDDALLSREVARIRTDAPIELDLADASFPSFDASEVSRAFSALGFTGITKRLTSLGGEGSTDAVAEEAQVVTVNDILEGEKAQVELEAYIEAGEWLGITAATSESPAGQLALDFGGGGSKILWVSGSRGLLRFEGAQADEALIAVVRRGRFASMDAKAALHALLPADSAEPALIDASLIDPARVFDVAVAAYLLDSESGAYDAGVLAANYLKTALPAPSETLVAEAVDAIAARLLVDPLTAALDAFEARELFEGLEMPLLPVLTQMERTGLAVDPSVLAAQSAELGAEIEAMAAEIHEEAGEDFNIDSPMQLSHVLFDVLGLPTYNLKKTQRGYYSTNAKVLEDLAKSHGIVARVLEYRERAKIRNTYLDALPALVKKDGRIHTSFNQTVAATGRLSSSEPNLQNIPTRSELGHRVRRAFTVAPDCVFLACDYSQIELRLLAHLSADEHLIAAFNEGADFHAATAARVFGLAPDAVTPELRARAKAVNFGIVYGQQSYGLSQSLKISKGEAQEMIDRYFEAYPGVREFLDGQIRLAHEQGYVTTMFGRRRYTRDINSSNYQLRSFAERTAMNHPMQGTAADIIKIAMVRVAERLANEGFAAKMVLQIHDELDFEVPRAEVERLSAMVVETMEGAAELSVPLTADVSWGDTWAEAK